MSPERKYIYNSPRTWEELVSLRPKISNSDSKCNRSPGNHLSYVLYKKFNSQDSRREGISSMIIGNYSIRENDFPYDKLLKFLPQVKHYCLWSRIGELTPEIIEQEINKKFPDQDYMWLVNSPQTQSVPQIWHCHIFVKEK